VQLPGQVRAFLAGRQLTRLTTQVALETVALADVAGGAVGADEATRLVGHAGPADLDEDIVPVGMPERQAHPMDRARVTGDPTEPDVGIAAGIRGEDLRI